MVEAANFSFIDTRRRKEIPLIKTFPRESNRHSSESPRAAKKAGSLQSEITRNFPPALSGDLPIFDCENCGGTHKSMNCTKPCKLCRSKGANADHVQYLCPLIPNAKERKQSQQPRGVGPSQPPTRSVKSATSGSRKATGSIISAITQDDEYHTEEDSEVSDYPVYIDTCASDIYTPMASNLDANSSHVHTRVMDRLRVEQADGTTLVSSGIGKFAGAPAYVMPNMSDTLLGANTVCKLGNIMLVDDKKIICVGSDANTRAALTDFYQYIQQNKHLVKFIVVPISHTLHTESTHRTNWFLHHPFFPPHKQKPIRRLPS